MECAGLILYFVEFSLGETENLTQHGITRPCISAVLHIHLAPLGEKEQRVTPWKSQSTGLAEAGMSLSTPCAIPVLAMHPHPRQTWSGCCARPPPEQPAPTPGTSGLKAGMQQELTGNGEAHGRVGLYSQGCLL